MRHRYQRKKLNRDKDHRQALFKNLIKSLITHEEIKTTESKAKAVRRIFDKLVTKSKDGTLSARRLIHAFLQDKESVAKLMDKLGPKFKNRPGGFTRLTRLGERKGDNAMMVKLELVEKTAKDKEEKPQEEKKSPKEKAAKTPPKKGIFRRRKKEEK